MAVMPAAATTMMVPMQMPATTSALMPSVGLDSSGAAMMCAATEPGTSATAPALRFQRPGEAAMKRAKALAAARVELSRRAATAMRSAATASDEPGAVARILVEMQSAVAPSLPHVALPGAASCSERAPPASRPSSAPSARLKPASDVSAFTSSVAERLKAPAASLTVVRITRLTPTRPRLAMPARNSKHAAVCVTKSSALAFVTTLNCAATKATAAGEGDGLAPTDRVALGVPDCERDAVREIVCVGVGRRLGERDGVKLLLRLGGGVVVDVAEGPGEAVQPSESVCECVPVADDEMGDAVCVDACDAEMGDGERLSDGSWLSVCDGVTCVCSCVLLRLGDALTELLAEQLADKDADAALGDGVRLSDAVPVTLGGSAPLPVGEPELVVEAVGTPLVVVDAVSEGLAVSVAVTVAL